MNAREREAGLQVVKVSGRGLRLGESLNAAKHEQSHQQASHDALPDRPPDVCSVHFSSAIFV